MDLKPDKLELRLVKPNHIVVDENNPNIFVVEPLDRGFGHTIANSLRRIMLSSIEGAAITWISIDGKTHEFDTIDGVKEDILDLILNLKALHIKLNDENREAILSLNIDTVKEPSRIVTGADFVFDQEGVAEIMNPEQPIATLSKGARLMMECGVNMGRGYVPATRLRDMLEGHTHVIGRIYLDATFSPVLHVNYTVEPTRHEQYTDYDKLVLDVKTNGTVEPAAVIDQAACILRDHLKVFMCAGGMKEDQTFDIDMSSQDSSKSQDAMEKYLDESIEELELSVRSYNCLEAAGIKTIRDLIQKTEAEMLKYRNFGRKSLNEIKTLLRGMNLEFDMEIGPNGVPVSRRK